MLWLIIEVLVAALLAVFIVWFTLGGRRKASRPSHDDQARKD